MKENEDERSNKIGKDKRTDDQDEEINTVKYF